MQADRFLELDRKLGSYVRGQARRHSKRVEVQEDFCSSAREWLSTLTKELDQATLKRQTYNAIHRAYRHELKERKLMAQLAEAYQVDGRGPGSIVPAGRQDGEIDGEIVLEERSFLQEVEPGVILPLFQTVAEGESTAEEW